MPVLDLDSCPEFPVAFIPSTTADRLISLLSSEAVIQFSMTSKYLYRRCLVLRGIQIKQLSYFLQERNIHISDRDSLDLQDIPEKLIPHLNIHHCHIGIGCRIPPLIQRNYDAITMFGFRQDYEYLIDYLLIPKLRNLILNFGVHLAVQDVQQLLSKISNIKKLHAVFCPGPDVVKTFEIAEEWSRNTPSLQTYLLSAHRELRVSKNEKINGIFTTISFFGKRNGLDFFLNKCLYPGITKAEIEFGCPLSKEEVSSILNKLKDVTSLSIVSDEYFYQMEVIS
ncbi:hypothetical protein FO519_006916 [Halicephalobus sp. NKZ332]|nr:hypothetical protein FO519_006916 [Halicephalobus sp. NKZ332]